jgi:hypothetical protein
MLVPASNRALISSIYSSGVLIMFRKTIIALTAIFAVSLMASTEASAWRGGWGGWRGGWGGWGGGWRGPGWGWGVGAVGLGIGLGLAATAPWGWGGYGYPPYGGYGYPYGAVGWGYGGACYPVTQQIWTPWGWRWRQVQAC